VKTGATVPIYTPEQPIALPVEKALIVNISETAYAAERTYGNYRIEGCKKGQAYTTLAVSACRGVADSIEAKPGKLAGRIQWPITAEDIAVDLVRQWNSDLWGIGSTITGEVAGEQVRGFAGVFVSEGMEPSAEELAEAHEIFALSDKVLIERAHSEWDQFHRPDMIHASWKRAARRYGVDAEWLYAVSNAAELPDCKFCGSKMKTKTATVCATCGRDQEPVPGAIVQVHKPKQTRKEL
jgi:hypothetical protein